MSHIQAQITKAGGDEEFPILCGTCLGDNPFIRMTKERYGKACKICDRPFTVYRWQPGATARFKKTELCRTCAKMKNVCQTCVLDLQYGLPVEVRDHALQDYEKMSIPESDINREFMLQQFENAEKTGEYGIRGAIEGATGKIGAPSQVLERLTRRQPYYKRNAPHLCSFFAKGECNRGATCPFRHEMPTTGELAKQNIKDRYYGQNDPVARKMMNRAKTGNQPAAATPEDTSITTLWIGGVDEKVAEESLREKFAAFGQVSNLALLTDKGCAFVTFASRQGAQDAIEALANNLEVGGTSLKLSWGKKKNKKPVAPPPGMGPAAPLASSVLNGTAPPPPGTGPAAVLYPSQDPDLLSAKLANS
eukprot:gb/GEZN01006530.1/.p1 GENE.gb/GEZN01006530.1/~~gb/GEZN01006530.1/.p1  ORF type:complete len:387 (-),score=73.75 gb/GEZN01006530.1/:489-1577(-)